MQRSVPFPLCILLMLTIFMEGCAPARQPIPPGQIPQARQVSVNEEQYGHQVLTQLQQKWPLDYRNPRQPEVEEIVSRLTSAAGGSRDPWHVYILRAPDFKNAAATRGNHVFVWTGIFDSIRSKDELAAVLAHEISHVLAGHTDPDPNEEMRKMLIGLGSIAAGAAVARVTPTMAQSAGNITMGVTKEIGSGLLVYPYSREIELEADRVGVLLMAEAKFNPQAAIDFWSRAERDPAFSQSVPFFSTHPPAGDRLAQLKAELPRAMARYRGERPPPPPRATLGPESAPVGAPPVRDPSVDSFDLNKVPPRPPRASETREPGWRVRSDHAVLFEAPDIRSRRIGEFRRGVRLRAVGEANNFIQIETPDRGYVSMDDLDREAGPERPSEWRGQY